MKRYESGKRTVIVGFALQNVKEGNKLSSKYAGKLPKNVADEFQKYVM